MAATAVMSTDNESVMDIMLAKQAKQRPGYKSRAGIATLPCGMIVISSYVTRSSRRSNILNFREPMVVLNNGYIVSRGDNMLISSEYCS